MELSASMLASSVILPDGKFGNNNIYDRIILSGRSRKILILRATTFSLCCIFFPFEAVIFKKLEEIEKKLFEKYNSLMVNLLFYRKFSFTTEHHNIIDLLFEIIGGSNSIIVYISFIYLLFHPFVGLKLVLVSNLSEYFLILLKITFQCHRPSWDLDINNTICKNTYPNPSVRLFYCAFFFLYSFISFNLVERKKFSKTGKLFIFLLYTIEIAVLIFVTGNILFLYIHQIVYTIIISTTLASLLIDYDTTIHNFIFKALKNAYNTRLYKMRIFFCIMGLFSWGIIMLYFLDEPESNKLKDKIRTNYDCDDKDLTIFGIKQSFTDFSYLFGVIGAFWGASFTVEKNIGKWWGNKLLKIFLIKVFTIIIVNGIFIVAKKALKEHCDIYQIYFALKSFLDFFHYYVIFGFVPLFFQKIGYNEIIISKRYEKIQINKNDDMVQYFKASIFEEERRGKDNGFLVTDKIKKKSNSNKNLPSLNGGIKEISSEKKKRQLSKEEILVQQKKIKSSIKKKKERNISRSKYQDEENQPTGFIEGVGQHNEEGVLEYFIKNENELDL